MVKHKFRRHFFTLDYKKKRGLAITLERYYHIPAYKISTTHAIA